MCSACLPQRPSTGLLILTWKPRKIISLSQKLLSLFLSKSCYATLLLRTLQTLSFYPCPHLPSNLISNTLSCILPPLLTLEYAKLPLISGLCTSCPLSGDISSHTCIVQDLHSNVPFPARPPLASLSQRATTSPFTLLSSPALFLFIAPSSSTRDRFAYCLSLQLLRGVALLICSLKSVSGTF